MIFSYRSSKDGNFPEDNSGFQEVDTNKTLAAGGSTTYSDASANLKNNPYIEKKVSKDKVEVTFKGQDEDSTDSRTMKGFNAKSVYDMDTDDRIPALVDHTGKYEWKLSGIRGCRTSNALE